MPPKNSPKKTAVSPRQSSSRGGSANTTGSGNPKTPGTTSPPAGRSRGPPARAATSGGAKRQGGGEGRKAKREVAIIDTVNSETLGRQAIVQELFAELAHLQVRYEEEGKKTKDHYISILERRLIQAQITARNRTELMEGKFEDVLSAISRILLETFQLGAIGITEGFLFSEGDSSPPPLSPASSTSSSRTPKPPQQTPGQRKAARIASPFGSSTQSSPKHGSGGHAVAASPLLMDNEDKIRRFFVNPQSLVPTKLETINVKELCARMDELRDGITGLVSQCVAKLSSSNHRVKNLELALDDQSLCLSSAERLLQNAIVRNDNSNQTAIDMCRDLGMHVKQQTDTLLTRLLGALDGLIRGSVEVCLDHNSYDQGGKGLNSFAKDALTADFCTELDRIRLFQDDMFRTVRERIVEFHIDMMKHSPLEAAKLFRSNIPDEHRRVLHLCNTAFDRDALLQLLDRVSFDPAAAETIIAVTQTFMDAHGGADACISLFSGPMEHASSSGPSGGNARPSSSSTPSSSVEKVMYAKALNAVAYSGQKLIRDAEDDGAVVMKNDGVLSQKLGLSDVVHKLVKAGGSKDGSLLRVVPASEILDPALSVGTNRLDVVSHPDAAGVVVPGAMMFVPPMVKGYVSSTIKRRMELEKTLQSVVDEREVARNPLALHSIGRNRVGLDAPHVVRLLPTMTPGMKRRMILDVIAETPDEVEGSTAAADLEQRLDRYSSARVGPTRPLTSSASSSSLKADKVVTLRLSDRFASAVFPPPSPPPPLKPQQVTATTSSAPTGLEALGFKKRSSDSKELPATARLYSEKQRSLLRQLLEGS